MKIVRESINFERGQDPKTAMGVGLQAQIDNWLDETYNMNWGQPGSIEAIGEDEELDKETKGKWIKHILSTGYEFDENEWYILGQLKIDALDYIPEIDKDLNDIHLRKRGDNYTINFDWEDFATFFSESDMEEFFQDILSGDGYKYFDDNSYKTYTQEEIEGYVSENDIDQSELIDKFEEYGGENPEEMWDQIYDQERSEEFGEIKNILQVVAANTTASAEEGESWTGLKKSIHNWYDMEEPKWLEDKETFEASISKQGAKRLMDYYYNQENAIEHREPEYYSADWDKGTFESELSDRLSDI